MLNMIRYRRDLSARMEHTIKLVIALREAQPDDDPPDEE